METNSKNIYAKLQEARVLLQSKSLKKSGKNTYSHYSYFELGDFLPEINIIFKDLGLTSVFNYGKEETTLTIIDVDNPSALITFSSLNAPSELKGALPIQSLGAMHTYMRRYMYLMALEIVENDSIDAMPLDNAPKQKQLTQEQEAQIFEWRETISNCTDLTQLRQYYKDLQKNSLLIENLEKDFMNRQNILKQKQGK